MHRPVEEIQNTVTISEELATAVAAVRFEVDRFHTTHRGIVGARVNGTVKWPYRQESGLERIRTADLGLVRAAS